MTDYVELRCQSAFSFLAGASLPEDLVERAAALGYDTLALADARGVYGAPRFFQAARRAGLRALVGAEVPIAGAGMLWLLVESRTGYRNLCRLLTAGALGRAKGEALVTWADVEEHAAGLHCLAGGAEGPLAGTDAAPNLARLRAIFGPRIAVDVHRHGERAGRFRAEVRDWLRAHVPARPLPSVDTAAGFAAHREWEHELAAARLSVVSWPAGYGGRDASLLDWLAFEEEYYAAAAPARVGQNGLFLLAPTLFAHGTAEQRDRVLPPMATAAEVWAQAWSEPDAGSDLAAIRASAAPADGGWLLSGTKTWSSRAAFADKAFGLFRSEPGAQRHRGLTYLMFDLRAEGVTVRPIRQLGGRTGFAEIFLDQVFAPAADVIGEPGDGWRIAMSTASHERGLSLRSPGRFLAAAGRLAGPAESPRAST